MKMKIKSLENSIETYHNDCKAKQEQLESFNPRLGKIIEVLSYFRAFLKTKKKQIFRLVNRH